MPQTAQIIRFPIERRHTKRLVPLSELVDLFGFSERWWRYRLKEGLPAHKWGGGLRFDPLEVEDWMGAKYGA